MWPFFYFKKNKRKQVSPLAVDIHSHLLPGLDDGVKTMTESLDLLYHFQEMGYQKVITTPHVIHDFYQNTPEIILQKLSEVQLSAKDNRLDIKIEAAAEYFLDEYFFQLLDKPEELLTFGKNFILFETGFINQPTILFEAIFKMKALGLQPILAHPERYTYLQGNYTLAEEIVARGALLQINLNSLSGYYSPAAKRTAEKLIDDRLVNFAGSDMHNERHLAVLRDSINKKYFDKLLSQDLFNNSLLNS